MTCERCNSPMEVRFSLNPPRKVKSNYWRLRDGRLVCQQCAMTYLIGEKMVIPGVNGPIDSQTVEDHLRSIKACVIRQGLHEKCDFPMCLADLAVVAFCVEFESEQGQVTMRLCAEHGSMIVEAFRVFGVNIHDEADEPDIFQKTTD